MPVTRPTQVALDCSRRDLLSPWERSKSREFGSLPQPALCPTHEGRLNRSSPYPSSRTRFESCWTGSKSPGTLGMSLFDSHSGSAFDLVTIGQPTATGQNGEGEPARGPLR